MLCSWLTSHCEVDHTDLRTGHCQVGTLSLLVECWRHCQTDRRSFQIHTANIWWTVSLAWDSSWLSCTCKNLAIHSGLAYRLQLPPPHSPQKSHWICINLRNNLGQKWGGHVHPVVTPLEASLNYLVASFPVRWTLLRWSRGKLPCFVNGQFLF